MEPDRTSKDSDIVYETHYGSVAEAIKLITHPFDGDKKRLREFIDNVDVAYEPVHPRKYDILLKFVKTKITGDARSKLIVRDLTHTWALIKGIFGRKLRCTTHARFLCMQNVKCQTGEGRRSRLLGKPN